MSVSAAARLEESASAQSAALLPSPAEIAAAVRAERLRIDALRMRALGPWLVALHLGHTVAFLALGEGPTPAITTWRRSIAVAHLVSAVLVLIARAIVPPPGEAHLRRAWLPTLIAGGYLVDGAIIAALDQRVTTAITPFVLVALAAPLVFRLGTLRAATLQVIGALAFSAGQRWLQPDASVRLSNHVNAVSVSLLAIGLAYVLDRALARDVRQRLRLERQNAALESAYQQVRELAGEAAAASSAKSRFIAHVSHEIRTPMNSILGLCSLLGRELTAPRQRAWLESIDGSCRLLEKLLEDVLDLSRIEAGRLRIEPQPCDVVRVIEQITVAFEARAEEKRLSLRCSVDGLTSASRLSIDEARLRQIVFNLVGNAIKFTESGSVVIEVAATPADRPGAVSLAIEVRDTGPGIAEVDRARVFEAFEQVRPGGGRGGGVGLGLAVVRGLVHEMGGTIELRSELGRGSVFRVSLPRVEIVDEAQGRASRPSLLGAPRPSLDATARAPVSLPEGAAPRPAPGAEERRLLGRALRPRLAEWRRYQRLDQAGAIAAEVQEIARRTDGRATAALARALGLAVESVDVVAIDRLVTELETMAADGGDT
jgi:signal transduction histidine kinase